MPDLREPRTGSAPNNSRSLPALPQRAACGRHPLLRPRRSGSPAGHGFPSIGNRGFILFNNALQLCEADVFRVLELALRLLPMLGNLTAVFRTLYFSNPWTRAQRERHRRRQGSDRRERQMGPPGFARPPYKLGPRALRALLFPDIYRETETP